MTTLLVASLGGHLKELHRLRPRIDAVREDVMWVTFDSEQSRSMLASERATYLRSIEPRDYVGLLRNLSPALTLLRRENITNVISTGSGIALAILPQARALRIPCHYIESATRLSAPSRTGALLGRVPGVRLYTQWRTSARGKWTYAGSVFDGFRAHPGEPVAVRRAVVMLGTMKTYPFRRLLERLLLIMPSNVDVLWQTGCTDPTDLPGRTFPLLSAATLDAVLREADVVVAHAGVGSTLAAFEAGKCPVLVPRRAIFGENVDEHQQEVAHELRARGLTVSRSVDELCFGDLAEAAAKRIEVCADPPRFVLAD